MGVNTFSYRSFKYLSQSCQQSSILSNQIMIPESGNNIDLAKPKSQSSAVMD